MNILNRIGVATMLAALPLAAVAEYPEKPVEFIVPWPPGDLEWTCHAFVPPQVLVNATARPGSGGAFHFSGQT